MTKLFSLNCGHIRVEPGALFGATPQKVWSAHYPCTDEPGCRLTLRSLLIDTGERRILLDTGIGYRQDPALLADYHLHGEGDLLQELALHGYSAADITDVVHTHLHFDHCGGTLVCNEAGEVAPAFPKANIWVSKQQWLWALQPNVLEAESFPASNIKPLRASGRLHLLEEEGELFPGLYILMANGHTRGQMIPVVDYKGHKLVFAADLIPTRAHILPTCLSAYDVFPLEAVMEKQQLLQAVVDNAMVLFLQHDAHVECCRIKKVGESYAVSESFALQELD